MNCSMQVLINILSDISLYLIIAYGFSICYQAMRFFHMAQAISLTFGAYIVCAIYHAMETPIWLSIILSVLSGILLMFLVDKCVYGPRQKMNLVGWQMMIVSLGIYVVLQNVVSLIWGDSTQTFRTWEVTSGHQIGNGIITNIQIITIIGGTILILAFKLFYEKTATGRCISAVSINPELSETLGVSKKRVMSWCIAIGSGLAAIAGILIAADIDMTPTMGFDWLMYGVVAMIIGGMGKMRHLILGALLLATAQHLSAYFFDSKWMNATAYIILVIFLYFRPYGFSGKRIKKTEV